MHFFITGISGFVGSHLTSLLLRRGHRVSGSYLGRRPELGGVELSEADLLDALALARVLAQAGPDCVLHLAGLSHVGESWQRLSEYYRVNFSGTENVLHAAAGLPVVFASSAEIYGLVPEDEQPLGEARAADPRTPYALTKAAAERIALARGAVIVRTFNLVGPGQTPTFALPAFAAQLRAIARGEQEPVLRVGNLSARRDFLHVEDGAAAYEVLAARGKRGEIYNVGSGAAHAIGEALNVLCEISGVEARVEPDPERMRPVDIPLLCADTTKIRGLGWEPRRTLQEALTDLWQSTAG